MYFYFTLLTPDVLAALRFRWPEKRTLLAIRTSVIKIGSEQEGAKRLFIDSSDRDKVLLHDVKHYWLKVSNIYIRKV